jgi:hypothetical protein
VVDGEQPIDVPVMVRVGQGRNHSTMTEPKGKRPKGRQKKFNRKERKKTKGQRQKARHWPGKDKDEDKTRKHQ